jgi:aminoglycoside phosphotransferase (APT) family kinase protein
MLKQCVRSQQNEPTSLRLIERYTSIPAPRVVDVGEYSDTTYLVMTRLCGQMLDEVLHLMSYTERDLLADDLGSYAMQLRKIPNHTEFLFCNSLGGPVVDHRIPDGSGGPFHSESDFNAHLTSHLGCSPAEVVGEKNVLQGHHSYFTHSDLHCTNLLVDRGRLSGIIDWECSGYMPEYWDFTKAMYSARRDPILESIFRRAFRHRYESELNVERKFWFYTPFGV